MTLYLCCRRAYLHGRPNLDAPARAATLELVNQAPIPRHPPERVPLTAGQAVDEKYRRQRRLGLTAGHCYDP